MKRLAIFARNHRKTFNSQMLLGCCQTSPKPITFLFDSNAQNTYTTLYNMFCSYQILFLILIFLLFQTELSQNLQQLSEKARSTTEFIQRLKGMSDKINVSIEWLIR